MSKDSVSPVVGSWTVVVKRVNMQVVFRHIDKFRRTVEESFCSRLVPGTPPVGPKAARHQFLLEGVYLNYSYLCEYVTMMVDQEAAATSRIY